MTSPYCGPSRQYGPPPPVPAQFPRTGYGRSLASCLVWAAATLILITMLVGPPPSAEAFGRVTGSLVVHALIGALPVWLIARNRIAGWPWWQLVLLALPCYLAIRVVLNAVGPG